MGSRRASILVVALALVCGLLAAMSSTTASGTEANTGGTFVPLVPRNIWTSAGSGGDLVAGSSREVQVTGVGGIPSSGVGAVVVDIHGYSNGSSHILVSPKGGPTWSPVLKLTADQDQHSNTAIVPPGAGGKIVISSSAGSSTKLTLDVQGYFTSTQGDGSPGGYNPITPERVLATHASGGINGPLNAGSNYAVQVAGVGEIPSDATAVFANVRVFGATQPGGLYASNATPVSSTWNALAYEDGRYNDSGLSFTLSSTGKIHLRPSHGSIQVVIDVQGYFSPSDGEGGSYTPLSNGYYFDSYRLGEPLAPGETRLVTARGAGNIPADESADAIVTTVQVHNWTPSGSGAVVIYDPDTGRNGTSSVAFSGTYTMPEMSTSIVGVSDDGNIAIHNYSDRSVHLLLAAQGYFTGPDPDRQDEDDIEDDLESEPPVNDSDQDIPEESAVWAMEPPTIASSGPVYNSTFFASSAWGGTRVPPFENYNATIWAACGVFDTKNKRVRAFRRKTVTAQMETVTASLRCGTTKYGFRHIKARGRDTDVMRAMLPVTRNWRDFADWTMSYTLQIPTKVSYDSGRETYCYSRAYHLYDQDGDLVKTRYMRVYLGETAQRIITIIPSAVACKGANLL